MYLSTPSDAPKPRPCQARRARPPGPQRPCVPAPDAAIAQPAQRHSAGPPPARRQGAGLSLVELLVALCITATLAALAWPHFQGAMHRARRSEAQTALSELLNAQSRYRSSHRRYAGTLAELGFGTSSLQHYQLRLLDLPKAADDADDAETEPFSKGFVALATPLHTSPQAHDRTCAVLSLTLEGRQLTHNASDATGSPSAPCWPQ